MPVNMPNNTFWLSVIASDRVFFKGRCLSLAIPLQDGEMGLLPHHENMIIAITTGEMRIVKEDGQVVHAVVGDGFAQIMNNRIRMLVHTAERPEDIDIRRAQEAKERAEEQLRQRLSLQEHSHSEASLARALTRLRLKSKYNN